jgi:hypothetical protein
MKDFSNSSALKYLKFLKPVRIGTLIERGNTVSVTELNMKACSMVDVISFKVDNPLLKVSTVVNMWVAIHAPVMGQ